MDKILFLNEKDRNTGLSLEHSDYRYKTAKPVAATKPKHDEVGFTIPYAMFHPIREPGLLCELLGDNPVRRTADLKMNFDFLVKDLYENEISRLKLFSRYIRELKQPIRGGFFLCGLGEEDFTDLPPELMDKFRKRFWNPELFVRTASGLAAIQTSDGTQPE